MKRKHRKDPNGEWGEWKPKLDPNYRKHLLLEEEDYIPTQKDPDMEIILEED